MLHSTRVVDRDTSNITFTYKQLVQKHRGEVDNRSVLYIRILISVDQKYANITI